MNRRTFFKTQLFAGAGSLLLPAWMNQSHVRVASHFEPEYPVVPLTEGPKYHWFGYYDKQQIDASGRYVLGMQVDFQHRSPTEDDVVQIGMVDLQENNRWVPLGESKAWGWQQGCMLQWIPGSTGEVLWNDREGEQYVTRVVNIDTGEKRTLPRPTYTVSPDGTFAVCADFARIDNMRLGYGYKGGADPFVDQKAPQDGGIHQMDLATGESKLIVSLHDIAQISHQGESVADKWHYFNHLLISPDNQRFIFLNRYRDFPITAEMKAEENAYGKYVSGKYTTRMFTADVDGGNLYELDQSGKTSHFIWRDPQHVLAWTTYDGSTGFFLFKDQTREVSWVGKDTMTENGHQTYLPDTNNEWILNDTYPNKNDQKQTLYLYHIPTDRKVILGRFYEPPESHGEWRCDLHPRFSLDGRKIIFDSTHGGNGRQMYFMDISEAMV
ncbi:MAG: hypothetical protein RIG62_29310 [Cyclobacteriaceae bacterium]